MELQLSSATLALLESYGELLGKDNTAMVEEALRGYFEACDEILSTRGGGESHLDYDEFWDGVEV
jgi:hypothetical protein